MTLSGAATAPMGGAGARDPLPIPHANLLWARSLVEGLAAGGVRDVVLSPGSRSSPLALAVHGDARLRLTVQIDERSAAFVALGIAKATRTPVALICTSGTATANYLPAIAEAWLAGVPLVALTADRPPELRGTGASQTIDQVNLFGSHVRLFEDLPCPGDAGLDLASGGLVAQWACSVASAAAGGPVHVNVPFREPLLPAPEDMADCKARWEELLPDVRRALSSRAMPASGRPEAAALAALAARLAAARRPLIVAGPEAVPAKDAAEILALSRDASIPVFADIASGLRSAGDGGAPACAHADLFLRDEAIAALAPDVVLRLGGIPTSKTLATWLARHRPPVVAVQPDARRRDPDGIVSEVIAGPVVDVCRAALDRSPQHREERRAWCHLLQAAETGVQALLDGAPREAKAVRTACSALPAGASVFLSSSMPIRWAEMYVTQLARGARVFVNRGANGIDGIVSSAIGAAIGSGAPTLLVIGDLAFLHDAGGLRAARQLHTPFVVLLLDNDGGGIFSHLPVVRHAGPFEPLFGTPQGCDLEALSRVTGADHRVARSLDEVAALAAETFANGGVRVIQWRTDREATVREQAAVTGLPGVHADTVAAGGLSWRVWRRGLGPEAPLLLLHGFTGTGAFWTPVANLLPGRTCLFPDLPGHGGTDAPCPPEAWRLDRASDALAALLDTLGHSRIDLAGYSMGGRLALAFALRHPHRVASLCLIGATPGIADGAERARRCEEDLALAATIERDGIEAFSRRWEANPLFATQASLDPALREAMRAQRLSQDPLRLAAALRAFGTGFQPALHGELARLAMPVLVMAGELDTKFAAIARDLQSRIPGAALRIIPGAGHAVPLERAQDCAAAIDAFLKKGSDPFSGGV